MLHFEGQYGVPFDKAKAKMYLKKAIDLGNPEAERMRFLLEDAPETKK